jgi:opacity protein-like surface antigen
LALLVAVLCVEGLADAEMYAGGQIGFALPGDLKSDNNGSIELSNSFAFGAKFGNFLEEREWSWLGFEVEAFNYTPHIKQQTLSGTTGSGPLSGEIAGKNFGVTTIGINAIARLPYSSKFEPYAGLGIGMNWMRVSEGGFTPESAITPSLNILAGVRSYVSESLALFGEFKYSFVDVDFDKNPLGGSFQNKMFMFGISYHFDPHEWMHQ